MLKSFPEILGKMENVTELVLEETPINELPCSFQNFTHLQRLQVRCCRTFKLPSCIVTMPKLVEILVWVLGEWQFPLDAVEDKVISTVSSNVECLTLVRCKLSNDFFPTALTWFSNVKKLNLTGNDFTILPECIKECHLLRDLCLDRCQYLQEVRGIPPNLEIFSAQLCISLTSTEMLLNQELHESGGTTMFSLPGSRIPDWFEHCSSGDSISFWFRNKFPAIALCLVPGSMFTEFALVPIVIINGKNRDEFTREYYCQSDHTYIFNLEKIKFVDRAGQEGVQTVPQLWASIF
ncbi:TMV resistance protein N [Trifolium repens]|nr:TMV resistance protein N [Trifolium repens]